MTEQVYPVHHPGHDVKGTTPAPGQVPASPFFHGGSADRAVPAPTYHLFVLPFWSRADSRLLLNFLR
jgi:hypothetical protein